MRKCNRYVAVLGSVVAVFAVTPAISGAAKIKKDGSEKVSYSDPTGAQLGQQEIVQGFKLGASELGWTGSSIDAALSSTKQVSDIQTMLNQKINGIASWTLDATAAGGAYTIAEKAGVPVVGANSNGTGVKTTVWWALQLCGPNSPLYQTAAYIAKIYPHAKTLIIGGPPVPSIEEYVTCFKKAAAKYGLDVETVQDNTSDTAAGATPILESLLTKYPDTQAIWGYNDDSALGASAALTQDNKSVYDGKGSKGIIDIGQNGDPDAITAIKQGRETGTWDPNNYATGLALIKALSYYIGPDKVKSPPKTIEVASIFYTKANIGTYKAPTKRGYTLANIPLVK